MVRLTESFEDGINIEAVTLLLGQVNPVLTYAAALVETLKNHKLSNVRGGAIGLLRTPTFRKSMENIWSQHRQSLPRVSPHSDELSDTTLQRFITTL